MLTKERGDVSRLPELWRIAYERDRSSEVGYADPAPERRAAQALAAFILAGLAFLALPGTLLGVWNLLEISSHHAGNAASVAWIQAHGQAQLLGWVGSFILGISLYILPKFQRRSLKSFGTVWAVWVLWTVGVAWRWWVGISTQHWRTGLVASALLELLAYVLAQRVLLFSRWKADRQARSKRPGDLGSWLGIIGFLALGVALLVNLEIAVLVAFTAVIPVYPGAADRMFLLIVLWGFVVPVAWGYGTRFVTIFLGLSEPNHRAARWLCPILVILVLAALTQQFWLADSLALAGTLIAIGALRIFRPSHRAPKLVGVYRHYPAFIRLSYGWLLTGALLGVMADIWSNSPGLGGASRHAVTVGFIATLIFALAPRLLPAFLSGRELFSSALMAASLWVLTLGCALRVASEAVAYSSSNGVAWSILPLSAFLELIAVILFVINMGLTLKQSVPAWFEPASATAELALHWYIASFPETRSILIGAGLKTLASVRDAPRSLSLGEAARADHVPVEKVLDRLRGFFRDRQPRRKGRDA